MPTVVRPCSLGVLTPRRARIARQASVVVRRRLGHAGRGTANPRAASSGRISWILRVMVERSTPNHGPGQRRRRVCADVRGVQAGATLPQRSTNRPVQRSARPNGDAQIPVQIRCDKAARAHEDDISSRSRAATPALSTNTPQSPIAHQVVSRCPSLGQCRSMRFSVS